VIDSRIGLLGDTHGGFRWTVAAIDLLTRQGVNTLIQLGDFGFVWHGSQDEKKILDRLDAVLTSVDARMLVVDGNHEGYAALARHYPADEAGCREITERITWLPRGWRDQTAAGARVGALGGAASIDRSMRQAPDSRGRGGSWWPQEATTVDDVRRLGGEPLDILLSHEPPQTGALRHHLLLQGDSWPSVDVDYAQRSAATWMAGFLATKPQLTFSGHYHFHLDVQEEWNALDGSTFTSRSVILSMGGTPDALAVADFDARSYELMEMPAGFQLRDEVRRASRGAS
jgi:hypothetical protein